MAGLAILKHTHDLSDEVLCERWVENPYYQFFCGEEFFQHRLVFDRSSLTRWRQRMGEEKLQALIQESLSVATRTEAVKPSELSRVIVDTTVQPKDVMFPTDAKLLNRARERLVRLAGKHGVELRQSYARVGKYRPDQASALCPRQAVQARQPVAQEAPDLSGPCHPRHRPQDRRRRLSWRASSPSRSCWPAAVREQKQHQRGRKVYSLHAPEVECIGKGKAHRPYEFGVKVSRRHDAHRSKGGQFVTHVKALPGNPYDGHTLATVIPEMEALIGNTIDAHPRRQGLSRPQRAARLQVQGLHRRPEAARHREIKRELRRRSAVEPVIGHLKAEHRMGRNYLAGTHGDAANAVLAAAGYNFRRLFEWLALLLSKSWPP